VSLRAMRNACPPSLGLRARQSARCSSPSCIIAFPCFQPDPSGSCPQDEKYLMPSWDGMGLFRFPFSIFYFRVVSFPIRRNPCRQRVPSHSALVWAHSESSIITGCVRSMCLRIPCVPRVSATSEGQKSACKSDPDRVECIKDSRDSKGGGGEA
jgi:hypothetical protein